MDDAELLALLKGALHGAGAAVAFVWHPAGPRRALFREALESNGWSISQEIVWVKNSLVFGRSDYQWRHEPCLYAKRAGAPRQDDRTQTTVWEIDKTTGAQHPTQKPVELFAIPMRNHTRPGDVCFEPFSGSGSQIVAAEQLRRRCYAVELEPRYVDVAVRRWEAAAGREAVLEGTDRSWRGVAEERGVQVPELEARAPA
jgi:DNA modification methylase